MTDAGFFKGTSAEQDARFADKKKKLMKTMKFGENLSQKVDMTRINLESIRPWIVKRITELLNFEDELVCDYLFNQLEERHPDPKEIQINMTGFLNSKNARIFLSELWDLLLSAMETPDGVPAVFLEAKKEEILKRQEEEKLVQSELLRKEEQFKEKSMSVKTAIPTSAPQGRAKMNPDFHDVSSMKKTSRRSSTSSSPSPRARGRSPTSPDKNASPSPEPRTRHSPVTEAVTAPNEEAEIPANKNRSPARSKEVPPKRTPDSDWRRDLMQGRRRSPPEMPENSYYGYEKRSKDRRHSKERDKERERRHDRDGSDSRHHHRSHRRSSSRDVHRRNEYRRRGDSHHMPVPDPAGDSRHRYHMSSRVPESELSHRRWSRKHEERQRSRSGSSGYRERGARSRHSNYFRDEDNAGARHALEQGRVSHKNNHDADESFRRHAAYGRNQSPEGPLLPPSHATKHSRNKSHEDVPRKRPKRQSSTSSESSESSSSSGSSGSSSDGSSSEGESSGSESVQNNATKTPSTKKVAEHVPEGPSLPPGLEVPDEPEGPSLPPGLNPSEASPDQSNSASSSDSSSSSSSSESDDEQSGISGSSSGGSSSSSSSSESDQDTKRKHHETKKVGKLMKNGGDKRVASPEGPALPPSNPQRYKHSKYHDSTEETLRQRALASLMLGSGKRRTSSRSP